MKRIAIILAAVIGAAGGGSGGTAPWRELIVDDGGKYFTGTVMTPEKTPVAFTYGGKRYDGLGGCEVLERTLATNGVETTGRLRVRVAAELVAEIEGAYRADFGQTEWMISFGNPGKKVSEKLSDIVAMRYEFEHCPTAAECPFIRGIKGDHWEKYAPYETYCWHQPEGCSIVGDSRPTHGEFPYFDVTRKEGGLLCAIGWSGNWRADFRHLRDCPQPDWKFQVNFRACQNFSSVLLPGENIRNARVVLIPHRGSDIDHVSNLWRAWFRKYNEPKRNAAGDALRPFTTAYFALDTGKPNSDGSISEGHDTWRATLEKIVAEKVVADFRWFDAGWYFDPRGKSIPSIWGDVGSWELDTEKWPGSSFRDSVDACLAVGMKTLVWFEPERVCDPAALASNYGYRAEWAIPIAKEWWKGSGTVAWNNLGDPDCLKWTIDRILGMMDANHVDFYREDNNADPDVAWAEGDRIAEAKLKLPRQGMTETKGVMGHLALWDAIVERGRRTGRCPFVDSCASGGGRNDLESLRRGFPLMRSDADRSTTGLRLSMTSSLCRWIPFHGSSMKETEDELVAEDGPGASPYVFRASYLPICNLAVKYAHNPDLDYELLRRNLAEWRSVSELLLKDFYVLTSWHRGWDTSAWTVFAYDDAEKGESIVLAFRQEDAPYTAFEAVLKFADPKSKYEITDADTGKTVVMSGGELRSRGLLISLPERKSSKLLRLMRH